VARVQSIRVQTEATPNMEGIDAYFLNNNFTFQKSCRIYIFYKKKMILGNGVK